MTALPAPQSFFEQHRPVIASATRSSSLSFSCAWSCACACDGAGGGTPVALTPKEFDLHVALLKRRGAVASRLELLKEVWGHHAEVMTRTVDIHIAELRRKLEEDPGEPKHILTVWKAGYRLEA